MGFVKAIVGALVGAIIAIVVLAYLPGRVPTNYLWYPLVTGLLTGLGVRLACGSKSDTSAFVTGGIAALIAAVAILGSEEIINTAKLGGKPAVPNVSRLASPAPSTNATSKGGTDVKPEANADASEGSTKKSTDEDKPATTNESDENAAKNGETENEDDKTDSPDDTEAALDKGDSTKPVDRTKPSSSGAAHLDFPESPNTFPRKRPTGWKDIAPYLFSGLGVLLAYQLGKVPTVVTRVETE